MKMAYTCSKYECFFDNWLSRYKHLKTLPQHKSILQKCPRFWSQAPSQSLNPGSILIELQKIILCTHASIMNAFCYKTVEIRTHKNIIAVWRARTHTRTSFRTEMLEMCHYETDASAQSHPHPHAGILQKMKLKRATSLIIIGRFYPKLNLTYILWLYTLTQYTNLF